MKVKVDPTNPGRNASPIYIPLSRSNAIDLKTVIEKDIAAPDILYNKIPDECPICHQGIDVRIIKAYTPNYLADSAQVIFQCPRKDCLHFFIGYYTGSAKRKEFYLSYIAPITPIKHDFGKHIPSISPKFVEIYNEASYAEKLQLSQICGVGYRKALEYLIKDYAISKNEDEECIKRIKSKPLSDVIHDFIDDPNIRITAQRATWLGNDETHYERLWEDKDLEDLKILIELTVKWIDMEEMTKDYKYQMPRGKK